MFRLMAGTDQAARLRRAREHAGYRTAAEAIRRCGWNSTTYYAHENGQNGFKKPAAIRYARAYRVPTGWLLTGEGFSFDRKQTLDTKQSVNKLKVDDVLREKDGILIKEIDVRLGAGAGGWAWETFALAENGEFHAADAVKAEWFLPSAFVRNELRSSGRSIQLAEILGDSMEPTLRSGDRVMVDTDHRSPSPPGIYALWDGFGVVVKRVELIRGSDPVKVRLISDNKNHPEAQVTLNDANIVGRVIGRISAL